MRLLDVETLRLHSFEDERKAPPYAILSHTWEDQEVTFEDVMSRNFPDNITQSRGAWKIMKCAQQAKEDGLEYIWVDTCTYTSSIRRTFGDCVGCIQKSSSAELSEAINSMFR